MRCGGMQGPALLRCWVVHLKPRTEWRRVPLCAAKHAPPPHYAAAFWGAPCPMRSVLARRWGLRGRRSCNPPAVSGYPKPTPAARAGGAARGGRAAGPDRGGARRRDGGPGAAVQPAALLHQPGHVRYGLPGAPSQPSGATRRPRGQLCGSSPPRWSTSSEAPPLCRRRVDAFCARACAEACRSAGCQRLCLVATTPGT